MGGSMFKKLILALAFAGLLSPAYAAGTINLSLTQQLDNATGKPLAGGKLYIYQAGTTNPQIAYQDTALTIPLPGGAIYTLDASGRIPQFFVADGQIKVRLVNKQGVTQFAADNLLVIGPSGGGGGGGGTVDPTTVLQTGAVQHFYGTGVRAGFVRMNGRSIGSASSGASERANSDTQSLFEFLWTADPNLTVSSGRGASANADWTANKAIALPDARGFVLAGMDSMGSTAANRLTSGYFGVAGNTLGGTGGGEFNLLSVANLPPYTPSGANAPSGISGNITAMAGTSTGFWAGSNTTSPGSVPGYNSGTTIGLSGSAGAQAFTGIPQGGTNSPFRTLQATMVVTIYVKL